jgi:hypothetical protein
MPTALLFTGHMVDLPQRQTPRFPQGLVPSARSAIGEKLAPYGARADAKGFASLARGGDILFHEECRRRGIATFIVLPFAPDKFIGTSVDGVPGSDWVARFQAVWDATPQADRQILDLPTADAAYAACNDCLLERARQYGKVNLIALWDGKRGDGQGGAAHFIDQAKAQAPDTEISVIPLSLLTQTE